MEGSSPSSPSRRSRRKAPPSNNIPNEVQVVAASPSTKKTSPKKRKSTTQVVLLPGDRLTGVSSSPPPPPPPPTEAPPVIQQVVAFMLVGPPASGKTALVKSWVDRVAPSTGTGTCNTTTTKDAAKKGTRKPKAKLKTDMFTAAATTTAADDDNNNNKNHEWSMDYFKKDLTFHSHKNNQLQSVRVQLWDCYGTKDTTGALEDWKQVLKHQINTILLTIDARDLDSSSSSSSVEETVKEWKSWLDQQQQQHTRKKVKTSLRCKDLVPVELLLTQSDQAFSSNVASRSAMWKRFGATMDRICRSCGIEAWHVTTASYDDYLREDILSVDELFCNLVETCLERKRKQQSRAAAHTSAIADQETPVALLGSPENKRKRVSPPRSDTSTIILQADAVVPLSPDAP